MAEGLGTALQKLLLRFESARDLQRTPRTAGAFPYPGRVSPTRILSHTKRAPLALSALPNPFMTKPTTLPVLLSLAHLCAAPVMGQLAIGEWRDHFPYSRAVSVAEGGGHLYCASNTAVFRYHPPSGEIDRITKVNALSDVGIVGVAWNIPLGMLVVHYDNGNLDLLQGDRAYNMADIKRANLLGNKRINNVRFEGTRAFLACGFGIVVVDLERREVRDTWFIGPGGSQVNVNDLAFHGDSIYAATSSGLFSAWRQASNLAAFTNWRRRTDLPGQMSTGVLNAAASIGGNLLVNHAPGGNTPDTLLVFHPDGGITRFEPLYGRRNLALRVAPDGQRLAVTHSDGAHSYSPDLAEGYLQYGYAGTFAQPSCAIPAPNGLWLADLRMGLVRGRFDDNGNAVTPNGPLNASAYRLSAANGQVYVATGAVAGNWTNRFLKDGVHHYGDGVWRTDDQTNQPLLQGTNSFGAVANDMMAVAVDPRVKGRAFVGSWDDGLLEYRDRVPQLWYTPANSSLLTEFNNTEGKVNIGGLSFDRQGNLWMTNPNTSKPIAMLGTNGQWRSFGPPSTLLGGNFLVSDIVAATNGFKWMLRPRGNGMLVFDDRGTLDDTSDDRYRILNNVPGSGGLPSNDVYALAEDLDGQMWVGTNRGVAVFYVPGAVFDPSGFDAQQILITQDGNVQILLETEAVSVIAIDGANRKWIGTETGGVFLLSPDGREQLAHFTTENSPLPSNGISSIAIDGESGEVFIATERGIISYRAAATQGNTTNECATVYPNPVHEGYTGPIAIGGLVRDSEVRIADMAGNLVYRTTSLGGQALWPGTDMGGNRVATGVYMVFVTDRQGSSKCNTKVLVVR